MPTTPPPRSTPRQVGRALRRFLRLVPWIGGNENLVLFRVSDNRNRRPKLAADRAISIVPQGLSFDSKETWQRGGGRTNTALYWNFMVYVWKRDERDQEDRDDVALFGAESEDDVLESTNPSLYDLVHQLVDLTMIADLRNDGNPVSSTQASDMLSFEPIRFVGDTSPPGAAEDDKTWRYVALRLQVSFTWALDQSKR